MDDPLLRDAHSRTLTIKMVEMESSTINGISNTPGFK